MSGNKKHGLLLLNDLSSSEDLFEDKTHLRIADTLYKVIQNGSSGGLTIGLEGSWGSGKSTVVSILEKKLQKDLDTYFYYFDAWAHEGDPLRRIFLESLIDQVAPSDTKLQSLKKRISNREKITNIVSEQTVTELGKWLAFAALFVPLVNCLVSRLQKPVGSLTV